jgi:hypothetical protein
MWKAAMSSLALKTFLFGPVMKSVIGTRRVPSLEDTSTSAAEAYKGGRPSPAGEAVPRLPPTVPRLRIWGEPTVREAIARPGSLLPSSAIILV